MCGITIFLSKNEKGVIENLLSSLYNIQNRGYDSAGVAYILNDKWEISKYASTNCIDSLELLKKKLSSVESVIGIGHTRWATHGAKTDKNSHPHISMNKKIIVVHNGIITNYLYLKNFLKEKNYTFYSETDTEIISNLIEYFLEYSDSISTAITKAIKIMEGTWALGIIDTSNLNIVYVTRHGSPLILGESEDNLLCCSEISGFIGLVNNYIILENNDIVTLSNNGYKADNNYTRNKINQSIIEISPYPYEYWTLKEIFEQPSSISRAMNNGGRINNNKIILGGLESLNNDKNTINNIIGLGCGTSYHATMLLKYYFNRTNNLNSVQSFDASEFSELDIPKQGKTLFIICSQSGETRDLINAINICKKYNCITLGVVNVVDSMISQMVDCGVYLNCGVEKAVASTKSFTSMLTVLSLISMWYFDNYDNKNIINSLRNIPDKVKNLLDNILFKENCNDIVNIVKSKNIENMFILGCDKLYAIAKEGALKIKEISYIHAEAYPSGSLKHGPFALLDKKTISILLIDKSNINKMLSTYHEINSRDTNLFVITDDETNDILANIDNKIVIPNIKYYSDIIFTVTLQYIAYLLSQSRNINPDKPRNLAKVVTVE